MNVNFNVPQGYEFPTKCGDLRRMGEMKVQKLVVSYMSRRSGIPGLYALEAIVAAAIKI